MLIAKTAGKNVVFKASKICDFLLARQSVAVLTRGMAVAESIVEDLGRNA